MSDLFFIFQYVGLAPLGADKLDLTKGLFEKPN